MSTSTIAVAVAASLLVLQVGGPWFWSLAKWVWASLPTLSRDPQRSTDPPSVQVRLTELASINRRLDRIEALLEDRK